MFCKQNVHNVNKHVRKYHIILLHIIAHIDSVLFYKSYCDRLLQAQLYPCQVDDGMPGRCAQFKVKVP